MREVATKAYAAQLKKLHEDSGGFGVGSVTKKHYKTIQSLAEKREFGTLLDYGCGKGDFLDFAQKNMPNLTTHGYDVASDQYSNLPSGEFDLVISLDVMEHVEFGSISNVLSEIRDRTGKVFLCSVANYPAVKKLSDGRNAHVTQMPFGNWFSLFSAFFRVDQFIRTAKAEGLFVCSRLKEGADWR